MRAPYPIRLLRNGFKFLREHGLHTTLSKVMDVMKSWFGKHANSHPITREEYHKWIEKYEKSPVQGIELKNTPLISILMPVWEVKEEYFRHAVDSIISQTYKNWELCIVDDGSKSPHIKPLLEEYANKDDRIKISFSEINEHISLTTNKCFDLSSGDYVLLMDNDDMLVKDALMAYVEGINLHPDADVVYSDEDKIDDNNERFDPYFRPNYNPDMLYANMYIVHSLYSRDIFEKAGKLRKGYEGSQDFDLVLRVMELTEKIYHIPYILYHWRFSEASTAASHDNKPYVIDAAKKSISDAIKRRGLNGNVTGSNYPFKPTLEIANNPSVEIIIPSYNKKRLLEKCVNSIISKSTYMNYTITVVDNRSDSKDALKYLDNLRSKKIKVLTYEKPFNFSAINNFAAQDSNADYLLFLNNDTQIITKDWIEEMLMWAQLETTGAVGAQLLFPDHFVQHAGVAMGLGPDTDIDHRPVANHLYYGEYEGSTRQFNFLNMVQNVAAVTAACMMISREKFFEVGMFDAKNLAVAFNDVDICLRLYELGYRNVYTPYAKLFHYESASRSKIPDSDETLYMYEKWLTYIKADPYYNQNFDKKSIQSYVIPQ